MFLQVKFVCVTTLALGDFRWDVSDFSPNLCDI
jgi:hypothetical protein